MKRFFKKHIGFVTTIGVSALIVLALLVCVLQQNSKMQSAAAKLQKQKTAIERLNSAKPSPAQENVEALEADTQDYEAKLEDLHRHFGRPYERALDKFCDEINIGTDDFRAMFQEYWEEGIGKNQRGDQIYALFVQNGGKSADDEPEYMTNVDGEEIEVPAKPKWTKDSWDTAMTAFVAEAQKYTLEEIGGAESASAKELLMSSLGVPRSFGDNEARCKAYISAVKSNLTKKFAEGSVGISNEAQNFGFTATTMEPSKSQLVDLGKVWDIVADLAGRVADSKVDSLEAFSIDSLEGKEGDGGFHIYRFQVEVSGTQDEIRSLLQDLSDAYTDSRVYIVRRMSLMKNFDAAQILVDDYLTKSAGEAVKTSANALTTNRRGMTGSKNASAMTTSRVSALSGRKLNIEDVAMESSYTAGKAFVDEVMEIADGDKDVPATLRRNYGRPVIGVGERCTASILVDYAVYVTGDLETE